MDKRESWLDNMKMTACFLVVLGHLLQGLGRRGIIGKSFFLSGFLWAIYTFHVQLFFVCSGWLYQKKGYGRGEYRIDFLFKKLISLGVPYLTFACLTWLLKDLAADAVNMRSGKLLDFIFMAPATAPYWFLYTLFFMFLLIPFVRSHYLMAALCFLFFVLYQFSGFFAFNFVLLSVAQYGFWFVLGMAMYMFSGGEIRKDRRILLLGSVLLIFFVITAVVLYTHGLGGEFTPWTFLMGCMAVLGFCFVFSYIDRGQDMPSILKVFSHYTFPIYLMHTILAGAVRVGLVSLGVFDPAVHVASGLFAGICGSCVIAYILEKLVYPEFFIYPWKVIRRK
ncbi:acyltransferase family protein [Butyrivibrio sp. MC2013]|uniref:acyltransferase family protein n=1 Tax=Butyrivibrio sp. MC2013 TaxID=1280686 RepID=UPI00041EA77A|nr:acyltransferase [Butyrivibrio sp. MC2013]